MSNNSTHQLPALFWIVAIAAVIWNVLGVAAYIVDVTTSDEAMAALPEAQRALYAAQPAWVTGAFAIAVFAGLGGSIVLALRKSLATKIYVVSLIAVVSQMIYVFLLSDTLAVMGGSSAVLPSLVIVIAAVLVWFSRHAHAKSWIS